MCGSRNAGPDWILLFQLLSWRAWVWADYICARLSPWGVRMRECSGELTNIERVTIYCFVNQTALELMLWTYLHSATVDTEVTSMFPNNNVGRTIAKVKMAFLFCVRGISWVGRGEIDCCKNRNNKNQKQKAKVSLYSRKDINCHFPVHFYLCLFRFLIPILLCFLFF